MNTRLLSEQEWVYNYLQTRKSPTPLVIGTRGTWGINGQKAIILIAFTIPDIMILREIHDVNKNPIRRVKYQSIVYYAVNIVDENQVESLIDYWKED